MAPTSNKWDEIIKILQQMRIDTLSDIQKSRKNESDILTSGEPSGDVIDMVSSERDRELVLLLGDREREKMYAIDDALLRIEEDEFGICEECAEEIPLGRLKAMPFARYCVKCKSDIEKRQAQTGILAEDIIYREIPASDEEDSDLTVSE